ncbi:MAG: hypothetical protein C4323_05115 [Mastigocladus sp. ERB_26_2]
MNIKALNSHQYEPDILRKENVLIVKKLTHPRHASQFLKAIYYARQREYESIIIDFSSVGAIYPNACVPIAAAIQYYRDCGLDICVKSQPYKLQTTHLDKPLSATSNFLNQQQDFLSKVWEFNNDTMVFELVSAFIKDIAEKS